MTFSAHGRRSLDMPLRASPSARLVGPRVTTTIRHGLLVALMAFVLGLVTSPSAGADPPIVTSHNLNPADEVRSFAKSTCDGGIIRKIYLYTVATEKLPPATPVPLLITWSGLGRVEFPATFDATIVNDRHEIWIGGPCQTDPLATVEWDNPGGFNAIRAAPHYYPRWLLFTNIVNAVRWIATAGIPYAKSAIGAPGKPKPLFEWHSTAAPLDPQNPSGAWTYTFELQNYDVVSHSYSESLFGSSGSVPPGGTVPTTFTGPAPCGEGPGTLTVSDLSMVTTIIGIVPSGCGVGDELEPPGGVPAASTLGLVGLGAAMLIGGALFVRRRLRWE